MMCTLVHFLVQACTDGSFTCSTHDLPDISHVMGRAPYNKLYSIMLTIYSCSKQAEARAYFHRLQPVISPVLNYVMLGAAAVSFLFGPMIGFFDVYYDKPHHMQVVKYFTIGEVVYIYSMLYVVSAYRNNFGPQASNYITLY